MPAAQHTSTNRVYLHIYGRAAGQLSYKYDSPRLQRPNRNKKYPTTRCNSHGSRQRTRTKNRWLDRRTVFGIAGCWTRHLQRRAVIQVQPVPAFIVQEIYVSVLELLRAACLLGAGDGHSSSNGMPIMVSILVVVIICTLCYCVYCWRWRKRNGEL